MTNYTATEYRTAGLQLLPNGTIWDAERDATMGDIYLLIEAISFSCANIDLTMQNLLLESSPLTATSMLPEWMESVGIVNPPSSIEAQRQAVIERLNQQYNASIPQCDALAVSYGLTPLSITLVEQAQPFVCGDTLGEPLTSIGFNIFWLFTNTAPAFIAPDGFTVGACGMECGASIGSIAQWEVYLGQIIPITAYENDIKNTVLANLIPVFQYLGWNNTI